MRILTLALLLLASPLEASPSSPRTRQIIIRFKDLQVARATALSAAQLSQLNQRAGATLTHWRRMSGDSQVLRLPASLPLDEVRLIAQRLESDPDVEFAEADAPAYPALSPNDTLYSSQWHYFSPSAEVAGLNLANAWNISVGTANTVVAVLDTGITGHAEFSGRTVTGYDFISDAPTANDGDGRDSDPSDPGNYITAIEDAGPGNFTGCCDPAAGGQACDSTWHGTHVAGTLGAATNNGFSTAGVNWNAKIMPLRVLGKCGGLTSDVVDAIRWAVGLPVSGAPTNSLPAKVLNLSLSGPGTCSLSYQTAINNAVSAGAVVVAAAGNDNADVSGFSPGSCANVISVAAARRNGGRASYSNFGTLIDITAPGGDMPPTADGVLSLLNAGTQGPGADTTAYYEGTSMATPHVAGAISLMLAVAPSITPAQILSAVSVSTRPFPAGTGSDCTVSSCGPGLLDAHKLLLNGLPVTTAPANLRVSSVTLSRLEWSWDAAPNAVSYDIYYATNTASRIASGVTATSFTLTSLSANFLTGIFVRGVNIYSGSGPGGTSPSTATLSQPILGSAFAAHSSSVTVFFTSCPASPTEQSCAGYALAASTASNFTGTLFSTTSANRAASQLQVSGLANWTTYFFRLATLNVLGQPNFVSIGSIRTIGPLLAPGATEFSNVGSGQIRFNWTSGGNPSSLTYLAQASPQPNFPAPAGLSGIDLFSALFTDLGPNTTYYFRAQAMPNGPYLNLSTMTLPLNPAPTAAPFSPGAGQMNIQWSDGGNPTGTVYEAELSAASNFSAPAGSSRTLNGSANFLGLLSNTTYYARVRALNGLGGATAFTPLGNSQTLPNAPGVPAQSLVAVTYSSITVQWLSLPEFPSSATCAGYRLEASTDPNFNGQIFSQQLAGASSSTGAITALSDGVTYYLRVGALNSQGAARYAVLGATATLARNRVSGTISGSDLILGITPAPASLIKQITLRVPAGALASATVVTLNTSVEFEIPPPKSNQGQINSAGAQTGFEITAGGSQPNASASLTLRYDPAALPPGNNPRTLQLARYDEGARQWTLLPSFVDTSTHALSATVSHFSYFAPFFVTAASNLDNIQIFPIPWEPGSKDSRFDAPVLTLSNLPPESRVRALSLSGDLVWNGVASSAGVLNWDGRTRYGHRAATGTYLLIIEGGGRRVVRRMVLVR
ncbi:MAG: S8 family peptidase [Elusimicrobia bacterium]|nr:S8 family peptidase [Elusimicrobiota bacterium]